MKIPLFILSIIIVIILIFIKTDYLNVNLPNAEINNHVFSLYLATTPKDQEIGLAKFNKINTNQACFLFFKKQTYILSG